MVGHSGVFEQLAVPSYVQDGLLFGPCYQGNEAAAIYNPGKGTLRTIRRQVGEHDGDYVVVHLAVRVDFVVVAATRAGLALGAPAGSVPARTTTPVSSRGGASSVRALRTRSRVVSSIGWRTVFLHPRAACATSAAGDGWRDPTLPKRSRPSAPDQASRSEGCGGHHRAAMHFGAGAARARRSRRSEASRWTTLGGSWWAAGHGVIPALGVWRAGWPSSARRGRLRGRSRRWPGSIRLRRGRCRPA
jgi:hypothetical protein